MILVDTSCRVELFRGQSTILDDPLQNNRVLLHPFVFGELLLGGLPQEGEWSERLCGLRTAPTAADSEVAAFIAWGKLAGTGIGYVDAHLLVSARLVPGGSLLSSDEWLRSQAERLGVAAAL